jgi:hypothetical protein
MTRKTVSYYAGKDISYPQRPSKPFLASDDPKVIRAFATDMEKYLLAKEAYTAQSTAYRNSLQSRKNELKRDLANENNMTIAQADVLFNVAWEDGHSEGIESVIARFEQLVEIIYDYNQLSEELTE